MDGRKTSAPRRRPLSLKEVVEQADNFDFNQGIALKHWLGAAERLYREGSFYKDEGNFANAYLLLLRHCTLVIKKIPTHTGARSPDDKRHLNRLHERIPEIIRELEKLKPRIVDAYEEWERLSKTSSVEQLATGDLRYDRLAAMDPALSWNNETQAQLLDAGHNQELAIRLAKDDYRRRDAARRSIRKAGVSEHEEQIRRTGGVWDDWDRGSGSRNRDDDDIQRQLQETRRRLDGRDEGRDLDVVVRDFSRNGNPSSRDNRPRPQIQRPSPQQYNYPSVTRSAAVAYEPLRQPAADPSSYPTRPPKEQHSSAAPLQTIPPPIPRKLPAADSGRRLPEDAPPTIPPKTSEPEAQSKEGVASIEKAVTELSRRKNVTFLPAAYTEGGNPLRPIFIPKNLLSEFLKIAAPNTNKGLELCGIICGRPINNALFVAGLLIPNQVCTSDTCETEDEFQIYEFCERENMIIIGWIHTHPTQTCFMSSRDLHTHASYQAMSPEAVAIVCAPKYNKSGIFRLTDPPGLPHVLRCPHNNTFHQHDLPEAEIYKSAAHPISHVYMSDQIDFDVTDLRSKR